MVKDGSAFAMKHNTNLMGLQDCMSVCQKERERERERGVCVCARERMGVCNFESLLKLLVLRRN